jgi:hypothetical protein
MVGEQAAKVSGRACNQDCARRFHVKAIADLARSLRARIMDWSTSLA